MVASALHVPLIKAIMMNVAEIKYLSRCFTIIAYYFGAKVERVFRMAKSFARKYSRENILSALSPEREMWVAPPGHNFLKKQLF